MSPIQSQPNSSSTQPLISLIFIHTITVLISFLGCVLFLCFLGWAPKAKKRQAKPCEGQPNKEKIKFIFSWNGLARPQQSLRDWLAAVRTAHLAPKDIPLCRQSTTPSIPLISFLICLRSIPIYSIKSTHQFN